MDQVTNNQKKPDEAKLEVQSYAEAELKQLANAERLERFIELSARQPYFRGSNVLAMLNQMPDAVFMADFENYKKAGYDIKKGEKAAKSIGSNKYKALADYNDRKWHYDSHWTDEDKAYAQNNPEQVKEFSQSTVAYFFDITQTNATQADIDKVTQNKPAISSNENTYTKVIDHLFENIKKQPRENMFCDVRSDKNNPDYTAHELGLLAAQLYMPEIRDGLAEELPQALLKAELFAAIHDKMLGAEVPRHSISTIVDTANEMLANGKEKDLMKLVNDGSKAIKECSKEYAQDLKLYTRPKLDKCTAERNFAKNQEKEPERKVTNQEISFR